jgi:hypothetical protein
MTLIFPFVRDKKKHKFAYQRNVDSVPPPATCH